MEVRKNAAVTTSFKRVEAAVVASLLLLGLFAIWQAMGMPLGTAAMPGPGMMPMALGILLALSAAVLIVWRVTTGPAADAAVVVGHRHVALAIVSIAVAGLLFERVGFLITSTLLLFALLCSLSSLGWWRSLLAAVIASIAARLFFQNLLNVALPPIPFIP